MPALVRPRSATLTLRLDVGGAPQDSDLTLATRDGEVVWRGQVGEDAWRAGLRLRARCQGTWQDAHWLLARTLLEAELGTHGLGRDGAPDLDVAIETDDHGVTLTTTCRVIPAPPYPLLDDTAVSAMTWHHVRSAVAAGAGLRALGGVTAPRDGRPEDGRT